MSKHRANATSVDSVIHSIRSQMSDREIVQAALALTIGDEPYRHHLKVAGRRVRLENRGIGANMGRFGGGWMTSIGVQMGRNGTRGTIIVSLGKGSIRIDPAK
jgi:hypothetical protein